MPPSAETRAGRSHRPILATARAQLAVAVFSIVVALVSAVSVIGEVSAVNVILLFFGGFGAGAMLSAAIARWRADAGSPSSPPAPAP